MKNKKVSFCKNAKKYDGVSIKTSLILNIFKIYILRPYFVVSNIKEIIPKKENRQVLYNHFRTIFEKIKREKKMIRLLSHIQSRYIQNPLHLLPILHSLKESLIENE